MPDTGKSAIGLDGNLAAALGYPIGILAIICLIMDKENKFVKFHALQAILLYDWVAVDASVVGGVSGRSDRDYPRSCQSIRRKLF